MKLKREYYATEKDGFYGAYYGNPAPCDRGMILMLGDKIDDLMVKMGVKWLHRNGCNVMAMASETRDYAYHDYPIESFEKAIEALRAKGNAQFGIVGASTTAMAALAAASFIPELTLTIALSPSDFVMEGFYRDGLDGARERPGQNESTLSYRGESLPYLPYANCDDSLDVSDAVLTARFVAEDHDAVITAQGKLNADMNRDGNLTGDDVVAILRKIAKFD